ncbi:MAG: hypothetical protein KF809_16145 [Chloroflexi bacterium]|nr:hypothetical protein [Chloroflexota bacterium]
MVLLLAIALLPMSGRGFAAATTGELQVVPVSTQHWVGRNTLIVALFDAASVAIADPGAVVTLTMTGPDDGARSPVPMTLHQWAARARALYAAEVDLDQVGRWSVDVTLERAGETLHGTGWIEVRPDVGTPALGAVVPSVTTRTMRDAQNLMRSITSDPDPITDFYTWSVHELLGAGRPFVLVFDSYVYRPNEACGGALGIVHEIFTEFPGLAVVHAEPWTTTYQTGVLTLDPPEGPARLTDAAHAYGLTEPPWVFVVDGDGRLDAKFTGVVGTDELRAAMASVSGRAATVVPES